MKILIVLLVLPFLFVSCGDKNLDRSLDGVWYGRVKTADLDTLEKASQSSANEAATYETLILKVDGENMAFYRSLDKDTLINQTEVEMGTYSRSGKTLTFNIKRHSCKANPDHPAKRIISYEYSGDFSQVKMSFFLNKSITLTRPDSSEEEVIEQQLAASVTGCFDGGKFKQGKVEDSNSIQNLEDIRDIEAEVNAELSEEKIAPVNVE